MSGRGKIAVGYYCEHGQRLDVNGSRAAIAWLYEAKIAINQLGAQGIVDE